MTYQDRPDPERGFAPQPDAGPGIAPWEAPRPRSRPYGAGRRLIYGLLWACWTLLLLAAGFGTLFNGQIAPGLLGLVLATLAGRYDYRIWTWQARHLWFLIIF